MSLSCHADRLAATAIEIGHLNPIRSYTKQPVLTFQDVSLFPVERITPAINERRDSSLERYTSEVELAGRYGDVRRFLHALETAPEFVVIDDMSGAISMAASGGELASQESRPGAPERLRRRLIRRTSPY